MLRHRGFVAYWSGVVFSQVGVRATFAANLYHMYDLTGSTVQVGFVGIAQAGSLLLLSPLGGVIADRLDRRRLIQVTQLLSMLVSLGLAVLTLTDRVEVWHILLSVALNTATTTFDAPARNALIPALVPRGELAQAFALLTPSKELSILVGPALAGLLIAVGGPGLVYALDAGTFVVLIVILALLKVPPLEMDLPGTSVWSSMAAGARYLRERPIIWQLMALDVSATMFGAYQVVLPALAVDVLQVGPTGYGLLSSAPAAGALLATVLILRLLRRYPAGHLVLAGTIAYGLLCVLLAQAGWFALALVAALGVGASDALAASIRAATVQLETPDAMRGRVTSLFQMAARGGPALGQGNIGWVAGLLGPVGALTVGGLVPVLHALTMVGSGGRVRQYRLPDPEEESEGASA